MFNPLFVEHTVYAFALGALLFIVAELLIKDKRYSVTTSFIIGFISTLFVFNTPESSNAIDGTLEPMTVYIIKAIWGLAWLVGIWMSYKILKKGLK